MYTDSRYKNSHKKSAKIFAKAPCKALDIKPRSAQNSQLHSFTASQLHSFTAESFLCPNKTITHNQIFSHKKVLQIGTIHQKQNLIGVSKGVSPLAAREKEGVIGGEKTLL
ncbi:hypothetical protein [Treponema denticola]|nr:hypothetical protein [Treponema denticola]